MTTRLVFAKVIKQGQTFANKRKLEKFDDINFRRQKRCMNGIELGLAESCFVHSKDLKRTKSSIPIRRETRLRISLR